MLLLFMLWVYFSWVLVLFGASVSFCLHQKERIMGKLETKIPPIGTNIKNFEALKYELTNKDPDCTNADFGI
jgi:uncharacterized BrkB/YihY/UPF0761 family membrane protein